MLNKIYSSNSNGDFKVIAVNNKKCTVQFIETGYTKDVYTANATSGKVRDVYYKSVYGVGYIGDCSFTDQHYRLAKQLWQNMMKRCYSMKDTRGYYGKGVKVSDRWLCFANFLEDLPKLSNFDKWLNWEKDGVRYNLDKDLTLSNNKVYCRELCSFVTEHENKSEGAKNMIKIHGAPVNRVGYSRKSNLTK